MSGPEPGLQIHVDPIEPQPGTSGLQHELSLNFKVQDRRNFRYQGDFIPLIPLVLLLYYSFPLFHLFLVS